MENALKSETSVGLDVENFTTEKDFWVLYASNNLKKMNLFMGKYYWHYKIV